MIESIRAQEVDESGIRGADAVERNKILGPAPVDAPPRMLRACLSSFSEDTAQQFKCYKAQQSPVSHSFLHLHIHHTPFLKAGKCLINKY